MKLLAASITPKGKISKILFHFSNQSFIHLDLKRGEDMNSTLTKIKEVVAQLEGLQYKKEQNDHNS